MVYRKQNKAINNLKSASKDILRYTSKAAAKAANQTAKWLVKDHSGAEQGSKLMSMSQELNSAIADARLFKRRMQRLVDGAPNKPTVWGGVYGWLVDHFLYLMDLIWGYIWPILLYFLWLLWALIIMVLLYLLLFYVLYLWIKS